MVRKQNPTRVHYTSDTTELFNMDCQSNFMKLTQKLIVLSFHNGKKIGLLLFLKIVITAEMNEWSLYLLGQGGSTVRSDQLWQLHTHTQPQWPMRTCEKPF